MEILIWKKTKDSDLRIGLEVCYQDINGAYSKLGKIDGIYEINGIQQYSINTAMGSYLADELKLIKNMDFKLVNGDQITFFMINGLAMTTKREVYVVKETETEVLFKDSPRKRKVYGLKKDKVPLLFLGHNLLIKADSDGSCMRGNACINLVSTFPKEDVKQYIKDNNRASMTNDQMAHVMLFTPEQADDSNYNENLSNCLYGEDEVGISSPLIESIRARV